MREIVKKQRQFFNSGKSRNVDFRKNQLRKLKHLLQDYEQEIYDALEADFNKPPFETLGTELFVLHQEIDHILAHLSEWAKPRKVSSSLINFPSRNYIHRQPYGVSLVISPWNYPVQLMLNPALGSISAGNSTILKPSEISHHTSALLANLINNSFDSGFLHVVEGDAETTQSLLSQQLDYIFFTGSTRVGKIIMQAAAEQLTPVTLELGGKSPAIIDRTADLKIAARRVAWGKFINAGQTCVSPDFVYIHESQHDQFCQFLSQQIEAFYGDDPSQSSDFARIISDKHFERLTNLIDPEKVYHGGDHHSDTRYIAPTIMTGVNWDDAIMQEEIFGPILPTLSFSDLKQVIDTLRPKPKPLALYLFSTDKDHQQQVMQSLQFGSGCINDTVAHLGNLDLPFGGIGDSGMGSYHGKQSFETFSHQKSIMKKGTWFDPTLRYPPYNGKFKWLKRLTKYL